MGHMTTLLPENLPQFSSIAGHYHMARCALVSMFIYGKSVIDKDNMRNNCFYMVMVNLGLHGGETFQFSHHLFDKLYLYYIN